MAKKFSITILLLLFAAPAAAELKYTMRMETRKATAPVPPDPMLSLIGNLVAGQMVPGGSIEMTCVMGEHGTRIEWNKALAGIPTGAVMLQRADGTAVVIHPVEKTYWKLATESLNDLFTATTPEVTITRTGEFSELAGVRTERMTFRIRVPMPPPAGGELPQGAPTELTLEGESWVAERFKEYTKAAIRLPGMDRLGMSRLAAEGIAMRQIIRSAIFGDQEIESVITAIGEEDVPRTLFEIPAGFREVPPPRFGL